MTQGPPPPPPGPNQPPRDQSSPADPDAGQPGAPQQPPAPTGSQYGSPAGPGGLSGPADPGSGGHYPHQPQPAGSGKKRPSKVVVIAAAAGAAFVIFVLVATLALAGVFTDETRNTLTAREAQSVTVGERDLPFRTDSYGALSIQPSEYRSRAEEFFQVELLASLEDGFRNEDVDYNEACFDAVYDLQRNDDLAEMLREEAPVAASYLQAESGSETTLRVLLGSYEDSVSFEDYLSDVRSECGGDSFEFVNDDYEVEGEFDAFSHAGFTGIAVRGTSESSDFGEEDAFLAYAVRDHGNNVILVYYEGTDQEEFEEFLDAQDDALSAGF